MPAARMMLHPAFGALLVCLAALPAASCSMFLSDAVENPQKAFVVQGDDSLLSAYAPVFALQNYARPYNRIGTARVKMERGKEVAYVDPASPTVYGEKLEFRTPRGKYTNLLYRVHFERVPFPFVTAGNNPGLLVFITLDEKARPVLVTCVHSCGCYLAVIPTSFTPPSALPAHWDLKGQKVHGEKLPGGLMLPQDFSADYRVVVCLRDEIHRVMDLRVEKAEEIGWRYAAIPTELKPMESLEELPVEGGEGTASFFNDSGVGRGLVRNNAKPLELLLMSWWFMDFHVGRDRRYAPAAEMGKPLYTSAKFWKREESDLWEFADCLAYWGWRL